MAGPRGVLVVGAPAPGGQDFFLPPPFGYTWAEMDKLERRARKKVRRPFRVWGRGLTSWYRNLLLKKKKQGTGKG